MTSSHPLWQLAKFGVVGAGLTALVSVLYLSAISATPLEPAVALVLATVIASGIGFFAHSGISFAGFGKRDRIPMRIARFAVSNGIGFIVNLMFVVLLVDIAHLPEWTPTIPFCFVTPIISFVLNRRWVFG